MNKKGFTLIELLAVIIILGILMIIAIPSVTNYINDSRKSAYVDTAKEIVGGARNVVNEGKLGMYDTNTTYYIPATYINTENGLKSPYGEFTDKSAYVGVIYDGKGYKYYWISSDDTGQGIDEVTPVDKLDTDKIKSDLNPDDILDKIKTTGIGEREKIKILNSNGTWDDFNAADFVEESGESGSGGYTGYAYLYNEMGWKNIGTKLDNERETVWCNESETGEDSGGCAFGNGFSSKQECLDYVQQYGNYYTRCVSRERFRDSELEFYERNKIKFSRPYFIKMRIKNDILVGGWVCFNIDNQEYCLKGADEGASYNDNINILRSIQSYFRSCQFGEDYSRCIDGPSANLDYITVGMGGVVVGNSYGAQCYVDNLYIRCPD